MCTYTHELCLRMMRMSVKMMIIMMVRMMALAKVLTKVRVRIDFGCSVVECARRHYIRCRRCVAVESFFDFFNNNKKC